MGTSHKIGAHTGALLLRNAQKGNEMDAKRHAVDPVYMASGYNWCRVCAKNIRPRGDGWVHTSAPFDSYRASTKRY